MSHFTNERALPDGPTLRRIALLVKRASEDDEALRRPMTQISNAIDELKRDIALGLPPDRRTAARLSSLIDGLMRDRTARSGLHTAIFGELHDLGRVLCTTASE